MLNNILVAKVINLVTLLRRLGFNITTLIFCMHGLLSINVVVVPIFLAYGLLSIGIIRAILLLCEAPGITTLCVIKPIVVVTIR
jgi:hypothetical protein